MNEVSGTTAEKKREDSFGKEISENVSKYITFYTEKELLGIDILRVKEIISTLELTIVPNAPDYIKGVINLRGRVIPVISLRCKLKLPERDFDDDSKIIIVSDNTDNEVGIIVDSISIVTQINDSVVEPPPATMGEIEGQFLKGVAQLDNNQLLVILNLEKVLDKSV